MNSIPDSLNEPDPGAIFAIALSLWEHLHALAKADRSLNLSECYNGMDQFMREVMRIADQFERWSCRHVNFDELSDVWPYLLEDKFGAACLEMLMPQALAQFDDDDCLRLAMKMRLPVWADDGLEVPVNMEVENPTPGSKFIAFRIKTVRRDLEHNDIEPYVEEDEPHDPDFSKSWFALYGAYESGLCEYIADRDRYADLVTLSRNLCPGIGFPDRMSFTTR